MIKFANGTAQFSQAEKEEVCTLYANSTKWLHVFRENGEVIAIAYNKERQEIAHIHGNLPSMLLKAHDCENGLVVHMDTLMETILKEE